MLLFFFSLGLLQSSDSLAKPYLPTFALTIPQESITPFPRDHILNFRVQVFPHHGPYSTPQGRELSDKVVTVTSSATCTEYKAVKNSDQEWIKGALIRKMPAQMTFRAGVNKNLFFDCPKSFVIHRGGKLKSLEYAGNFVLLSSPAHLKIINVVDGETYLKGVIPTEVYASWPDEVLKAQAIAARTFAWWTAVQMRSALSDIDMDDTVLYQAYMGLSSRDPKSDAAGDATSGMIMTYGGDVIKAYFSADSGGFTEDAAEVFEPLPYCKANRETYDQTLYPASAWTKIFTYAELKKVLAKAQLLKSSVTIEKLTVADRTPSGRAKTIIITGKDKHDYLIDGSAFRFATRIRSNLFDIAQSDHSFVFSGRGFGHGVGMAQIGALQYSQQLHWTYQQILNFYYSGVNLVHD